MDCVAEKRGLFDVRHNGKRGTKGKEEEG